jgi:protease II
VTGNVNDPYAWLLQKDDRGTLDYLTAENAFADDFFASQSDTVETIFQEIKFLACLVWFGPIFKKHKLYQYMFTALPE